jgi:transcription antitermination factor NusG
VSSSGQVTNSKPRVEDSYALVSVNKLRWYAIRTRSRHEKVVGRQLQAQGIQVFLPLVTCVRQWSDRHAEIELPLFPGYTFVRIVYFSEDRIRILKAGGVVSFVGQNSGVPIPDEQIETVRAILTQKVPVKHHPFLRVGQRIRVRSGSLKGVEGILVAVNGSRTLVISVEPIERSLCIKLDGYDVEVVYRETAKALQT